MTLLQTITPEHLPGDYALQIAVYQDVKNASFLQEQLLAGNTDFEYAFIDASVVSFLCIAKSVKSSKDHIYSKCLSSSRAN